MVANFETFLIEKRVGRVGGEAVTRHFRQRPAAICQSYGDPRPVIMGDGGLRLRLQPALPPWIGDRQPPTAITPPGNPQIYLPQCQGCSNTQGGLVRGLTNNFETATSK